MKDAKGHGSDPRGAVHADSTGSPSRRGRATGFLASPQAKYAVNQNAARSAEGGKLSTAAGERIAMRQQADESHNPTMSISDRMAAATLAQGHPKSAPVPLGGSFAAAKSDLERGRSVALPRGAENRRKS